MTSDSARHDLNRFGRLTTIFVPDARQWFGFAALPISALGWCGMAALVGAGWIEIYKMTNAAKKPLKVNRA